MDNLCGLAIAQEKGLADKDAMAFAIASSRACMSTGLVRWQIRLYIQGHRDGFFRSMSLFFRPVTPKLDGEPRLKRKVPLRPAGRREGRSLNVRLR